MLHPLAAVIWKVHCYKVINKLFQLVLDLCGSLLQVSKLSEEIFQQLLAHKQQLPP